jgi:hypothetical protein
MERVHLEYALINTPNACPEYSDFVTNNNIRIIAEDVSRIVMERFPRGDRVRLSEKNIRDVMWEVFSKEINHTQIMIQMVINLMSQQIILKRDQMDTSQYDPRVLYAPELLGISLHNPGDIKLNHKRNEPMQFTYHL